MSRTNNNVKEAVETIYELTKDGGYTGNLTTLGDTATIVIRLLKESGTLTEERNGNKAPTYRWNAQATEPTPVFIRKISEDYRKLVEDMKQKPRQRPQVKAEITSSRLGFHAVFPQPEPDEEERPEPEPAPKIPSPGPEPVRTPEPQSTAPVQSESPFHDREMTIEELVATFTDEFLWKELLRRGWTIQNNRLVKTIVMNCQ
jgi:hypothetical protein